MIKYTEKDIKVGTKLICVDNDNLPWWTTGGIYEVQEAILPKKTVRIIDDDGSEIYLHGILDRLSNCGDGVQFEIVEE